MSMWSRAGADNRSMAHLISRKILTLSCWLLIVGSLVVQLSVWYLFKHPISFAFAFGRYSLVPYLLLALVFCFNSNIVVRFSVCLGLTIPTVYAVGCAELYFCAWSDSAEYTPLFFLSVLQILGCLGLGLLAVILTFRRSSGSEAPQNKQADRT